jgi:acetoin utilization deacetylase AcuC-like enzyme
VAIVDVDVHHGNANEDTWWEDAAVLHVNLNEDGIWPGPEHGDPTAVRGPPRCVGRRQPACERRRVSA